MKNLIEAIEKFTQGYSKRTLTAEYLSNYEKKEQERAVKAIIENLERDIIMRSRENHSCLIKTVSIGQTESYKKVLGLALKHFEEKGFKVLKRDLTEIGDPETKYYILSWKEKEEEGK